MPRRILLLVTLAAAVFVLPTLTAPVPVKKPVKEITNSIGMKLVRINPGTFTMGSTKDEDEKPEHEVEITKAFYMGVYTVTQAEFKKVMGYNPSYFSQDGEGKTGVTYGVKPAGGKAKVPADTSKFPVENVSWEEAKEFCEKLTKEEKSKRREYRLPTEAEWEFACRAGTRTKYHSGEDEDDLKKVAWYTANSDSRTHQVGTKDANAWGLHDMHGNVWQWCADCYAKDYYRKSGKEDPKGPESGTSRVLRGGSWFIDDDARKCRSASREFSDPGIRDHVNGFRVACAAPRTR
jgi:formylglycine-generating enzyme required for sulfatase activity